jgi:hypothetical protein
MAAISHHAKRKAAEGNQNERENVLEITANLEMMVSLRLFGVNRSD